MRQFAIGIALGIVSFTIFSGTVSMLASSPLDIIFPVSELGNCTDKESCKTYCNDPANKDACLSYAEKHNLIPRGQIEKAKRLPDKGPGGCEGSQCKEYCSDENNREECLEFGKQHGLLDKEDAEQFEKRAAIKVGPGGCKGEQECKAYCDDPTNTETCLAFAEMNGLVNRNAAKASMIVIQKGGPGGCRSPQECAKYCSDPANMESCLSFAKEEGLITGKEAEKAKKYATIASSGGPGGCRNEKDCKAFCADPNNSEICLNFAEREGLMTKSEAEKARKIAGKPGPGGCRGEACKQYCADPANMEACMAFAEENGLISKQEAERAKKFGKAVQQGGPGGCKGDECRNFCEKEENRKTCFEFAKKEGLLSKEEQDKFETGEKLNRKVMEAGGPGGCRSEQECHQYCKADQNFEECAAFAVAHGGMSKEQAEMMLKELSSGRGPGGPAPEDRMERFEQFQKLEENFRSKFPEGQIPVGPGGCKTPQECMSFCVNPANRTACLEFGKNMGQQIAPGQRPGPEGGMFPPEGIDGMERPPMNPFGGSGRPDCSSPEECRKLCLQNLPPEKCLPPGEMPLPGMPTERFPEGQMPPGEFQPGSVPPYQGAVPPTGSILPKPQYEIPEPCKQGPDSCKAFCAENAENPFCLSIKPLLEMGPYQGGSGSAPAMPMPGTTMTAPMMPPPSDFTCPTDIAPVCGADGKTYSNGCFAQKAGAAIARPGPCESQMESIPPPPTSSGPMRFIGNVFQALMDLFR